MLPLIPPRHQNLDIIVTYIQLRFYALKEFYLLTKTTFAISNPIIPTSKVHRINAYHDRQRFAERPRHGQS